MFLSIIIPVYNVENYLRECLDSCVNQNVPLSEYEVICIDDGSPDNCGEILDEYASKYSNFVVIHKENGGVSSARNAGLDIATGEYIYFIDSDDMIEPDLVSIFKLHSETNPDSISINSYRMKSDKFTDEELKLKERGELPASKCMMGTSCFKKAIIDEHKIRFRTDISLAEDGIFVNDFNHHSKSNINTGIIAYYYRNTPGSLLHKPKREKVASYIALIKVFNEYFKDPTYDPVWLEYKMYSYVYDSIDAIVRLPVNKWKKYIREIKAIGIWGQKPSKAACEKLIVKKTEGKPDAVNKNLKSYALGACLKNVFRLFFLYKMNKWFNIKIN